MKKVTVNFGNDLQRLVVQMLREDIQKEYQEKITKIDEEKAKAVKESAALAREKSTIQNLKQELEVRFNLNLKLNILALSFQQQILKGMVTRYSGMFCFRN